MENQKEGNIDYYSLVPIMGTLVSPITGELDYQSVYHLLPIHITKKDIKYIPKKKNYPVYGAGKIFATKLKDNCRCQFKLIGKTFPNCSEILISTGKEVLPIKIYRNCILVVGSKDRERTEKCVSILVKKILNIRKLVNLTQREKEISEKIHDWLNENIYTTSNKGKKIVSSHKLNTYVHHSPVEEKIFKFLTSYVEECELLNKSHDYYMSKIRWMIDISDIGTKFTIAHLSVELRLVKFYIGFKPNLLEFRNKMRKYDDLNVLYDPLIHNNVMVKIYFSEDYIERHSFEVKKSGEVRMSSKCLDEAKDAYNSFVSILCGEYGDIVHITP